MSMKCNLDRRVNRRAAAPPLGNCFHLKLEYIR